MNRILSYSFFLFPNLPSCQYTICSNEGECDSGSLIVSVTKAVLPPIAENDVRTTTLNTPIEILVTGNDMSPNDFPLTVVEVEAASYQGGDVSIIGDGSSGLVTYVPPVDYIGVDQFYYSSKYLKI